MKIIATPMPIRRRLFPLLAPALTVLAAVLAARADYPSTVTNLNPVGYWRLNEAASTNLANLVTGTVTNYGSAGAAGNGSYYSITRVGVDPSVVTGDTAPLFNNNSNTASSTPDYVEVSNLPQLLTNFNMSIECWVLRTNVPPVGTAISGGCNTSAGNDYKGFLFFLDNNGVAAGNGPKNYYCRLRTTTGGISNDFANVNCNTGSLYTNLADVGHWDHVVYAWNTNHVQCYVNGIMLVSNGFAAGKWYTPSTNPALPIRLIGDSQLSPGNIAVKTMLAQVAFYPYELTAAQVASHCAATNSSATYKATILADHPAGYWPLNESGPLAPPSNLVPITCTNLGRWGAPANGVLTASAVFNTGAAGVPYSGFGGAACAMFPGGNNAVTIPPQSLNAGSFSMSLWLKLPPGNAATVFSRPFDSPNLVGVVSDHCGISFGNFGSPGMINNQIGAQLNGPFGGTSTPLVYAPSNQWAFATMVVNPTQTTFYLNGLAATNAQNTTAEGSHDFSLNNMLIGAGYAGFISDVAVFDYALSPAQVAALYAAAGVPSVTNNLAVTAPDGSGNFSIRGTAGRGQTANLWMSTNLSLGQAGWTEVGAANGDSVTGGFSFTNNASTDPEAFFRLR